MNYDLITFGDQAADTLLIQPVDDHDLGLMEKEVACLQELAPGQSFCLQAVKVEDWNRDLSPWPAPAVFGKEDFRGGAAESLAWLDHNLLTGGETENRKRIFLGGYSLAGLFALWAAYQTDHFHGIAAASPSIWFPGFMEYMEGRTIQSPAVYLSLGDREEKTRNPVMARVGTAIREAYDCLQDRGVNCILEWNKGNHFKNPDLRTAKAFAWLMKQQPIL